MEPKKPRGFANPRGTQEKYLFTTVAGCDSVRSMGTKSTTLMDGDGREVQVGSYYGWGRDSCGASNPTDRRRPPSTPLVFISHTGNDGTKEMIARPTHWFLTAILGVSAFLDSSTATTTTTRVADDPWNGKALSELALTCTHALILLSPSFRMSNFCVMELNTFMERQTATNGDGIRVLPAMWNLERVDDGYSRPVQELNWLRAPPTNNIPVVEYLVGHLWPRLAEEFGRPGKSRDEYISCLMQYVNSRLQQGASQYLPADLARLLAPKVRQKKKYPTSHTTISETKSQEDTSPKPEETLQHYRRKIQQFAAKNKSSAAGSEQQLHRFEHHLAVFEKQALQEPVYDQAMADRFHLTFRTILQEKWASIVGCGDTGDGDNQSDSSSWRYQVRDDESVDDDSSTRSDKDNNGDCHDTAEDNSFVPDFAGARVSPVPNTIWIDNMEAVEGEECIVQKQQQKQQQQQDSSAEVARMDTSDSDGDSDADADMMDF